jgi:transcription elongation factor Elf1
MNGVNEVKARCAQCGKSRLVETVADAQAWLQQHDCTGAVCDGSHPRTLMSLAQRRADHTLFRCPVCGAEDIRDRTPPNTPPRTHREGRVDVLSNPSPSAVLQDDDCVAGDESK